MIDAHFIRMAGCALIAFAACFAGAANAAGTFDSVSGNVTMIGASGSKVAASPAATVPPGTTIMTGDGAQAVIKFDDGGAVVLGQNTQFKLVDYRYDAAKPGAGRSVFDFLKGAARFVTGLIARTEPANYQLRTLQVTIGVRGTDFDLASGSLYLSVEHGVVSATNSAGTVAFGTGQAGFVRTAATLPEAIPASQFPGEVASAFAHLNAVSLPAGTLEPLAGGDAAGAGEATGTAAAASGGTAAAIIAAGVAAMALSNYKSSSSTVQH